MLKTGVCSVTFRKLSVERIIELVVEAGLDGIEWGGDVHVPTGSLGRAKEVEKLTTEAGLEVVSYGSYYRVGEVNEHSFDAVLDTAIELGAPMIRVWAGKEGSDKADNSYRDAVVKDARRIANLASEKDVLVSFEYHRNTLTDTKESASQLMVEVNHPNIGIYWQPEVSQSVEARLASIDAVYPWLTFVHVFYWHGTNRLPLNDGIQDWQQYLQPLTKTSKQRYFLLEFVKQDDPEQFLQDATVLKDILGKYKVKE